MHSQRIVLRLAAVIVVAAMLVVTAIFTSAITTASAEEEKTALFGVVTGNPLTGLIEVVTRDGAITLIIDDQTTIRDRKGGVKLSEIKVGMTVAGYYTDGDGGAVAKNLTFVSRKQKKSFEHVVGVILERKEKTFTVKTAQGELIEIELGDDDEGDEAQPGSMIATVVERDEETGELKSKALQTAQETVDRLNKSIDYEISLAQRKLLKTRISVTATVHMTRLYEALDEIKADTKARIQAAYEEFQVSYEATLRENLLEPVTVKMTGTVISVSGSEVDVLSVSDGTVWKLRVTGSTVIKRSDGTEVTIADILPGQTIEIQAAPGSATGRPMAKYIRLLLVEKAKPKRTEQQNDNTIIGTIILVESGSDEVETVVVVALDDGSDSAASLSDDTVVVVDGEELSVDELEAGQEVEIILAADGFSAEEITAVEAVEPTPEPTSEPGSEPSGTAVLRQEYVMIGTLRSIDDAGVVLDGISLTLEGSTVSFATSSIGQQVELRFFVDDAGRLVMTGIK